MPQQQDKYKLSKYNVIYKDGDVGYIWNTFNDALITVNKQGLHYIENFCGLSDDSLDFEILKENGFIVYEQIDEYGRVFLQEKNAIFSYNSNRISFVIALGLSCNYNCNYCFQSATDKSAVMTTETAIAIANYICEQLENNPCIHNLDITWFGGEPLLHINLIEIISKMIMECVQDRSINYQANIITNGRFMDNEALETLIKLKIKSVQITVDGTCDVYCKSKNANPNDFNIVMNNICYAADKVALTIRLNIPNNVASEAISITDYLYKERDLIDKISIYFAYVHDYSAQKNVANNAFIDYVQNCSKWLDYVVDNYGITTIKTLIPKRTVISCRLMSIANMCIGPNGDFYKCQHRFGEGEMVIGNIYHGRFYNKAEYLYYSVHDEFSRQNCAECEFVPICLGFCSDDCINGYLRIDCSAYKSLQLKLKLLECGMRI